MSARDYLAHEPLRPRKLDGLRRRPVVEVAAQLGIAVVHGRMACPACGAEGRACSINPDGMGWRCWTCDAKGDALILAGWRVCGRRVARGDDAGWTAISAALGGPVLDAPPPRVEDAVRFDPDTTPSMRVRRQPLPGWDDAPPMPLDEACLIDIARAEACDRAGWALSAFDDAARSLDDGRRGGRLRAALRLRGLAYGAWDRCVAEPSRRAA